MSGGHEEPTSKVKARSVVLAIACTAEFVDRCRDAALAFGAILKECELVEAATAAARYRPLVLLMNDDVYEFDRREFDALARDVGAKIVPFDTEELDQQELERLIGWAVSEADRARRRRSFWLE